MKKNKQKHPSQRKTVLVNVRLQLITVFYGALTAFCGGLFTALIIRLGYPEDSSLAMMLFVIGNAIFCFTCIFLLALFYTNRIFGPIYRLHKEIKKSIHDKNYSPIKLRTGDEFIELIADFNKLMIDKKNDFN